MAAAAEKDWCEITGTSGKIGFSVFDGSTISVTVDDKKEQITFEPLQHVQQPMIAAVVEYFSDRAENPCSGQDGALIMQWMEAMTRNP